MYNIFYIIYKGYDFPVYFLKIQLIYENVHKII